MTDFLLGSELDRYRASALHLPRIPRSVYSSEKENIFDAVEDRNNEQINNFAARRKQASLEKKMAGFSSTAVGGDVFAAIPRFYSPLEYFEQTQIPYDINNKKHRFELYKWLDLFYRTHYLIPILVDIFTRFPLVGVDLFGPDKQLNDFYRDAFLDRLDYEQFFVDMGREYWVLGQSFPMGSFHEELGVWESEELMDPTLVEVKRFPIIGGDEFFIVPPKELVDLVKNKRPRPQYVLLEKNYPDLIPFLRNGKNIPISDVLMRQVAFKASPRDLYGTPILLRALRTLMHEEKLMASQDAIAERLYSPLILAKIGTPEMGAARTPWIPGPNEISSFRNDLDLALSSDFRLIVHHFAIDIQNVFGREQMPRLDNDFDRVEKRILQTFGVSPSLLSGGQASTPYASSALQAEFLNQILRTYQRYLIRHYESRAKIVAEAHEHYEYEKRGDTRIPIMEEVLVYDDDGNQHIEKRNKLMIPEMRMKVLDLRDEATQRNFLQALKQQGVPIPDQDITMGMHYNFDEALEKVSEEMIAKTIKQQEAKLKTYDILVAEGLPVPPNLLQELQAAGLAPGGMGPGGMGGGEGDTFGNPLGPGNPSTGGGGILMPPPPGGAGEGRNPMRGTIPEESNERREQNNPNPGQSNPFAPKGPTIPGVPGQVSALGIPGGASPAISPSTTGQPGYRHTRTELPKAKRKLSHELIREADEEPQEEPEDIIPDS